MKNRLTTIELNRLHELKDKAKTKRTRMAQAQYAEDMESYGHLPACRISFQLDMNRPLTDFLDTDDAIELTNIKLKLK